MEEAQLVARVSLTAEEVLRRLANLALLEEMALKIILPLPAGLAAQKCLLHLC